MMRTRILAMSAALVTPLGLAAPTAAAEPVTLTGMTWLDENFDGIRQDGEGALWKWPVRVEKAEGGIVARGQTGVGGRYSFDDLPPGKYRVAIAATPERWPTLFNVGADDRDSDVEQMSNSSQELDCTGGPCGVVDGGLAEPHSDVALQADPSRVTVAPQGRATVRVDVTNTGNQPWQAPVYLPPQGVKVENPHGDRWYCNTADPQRQNCTPTAGALMPGEKRSLLFDIVAADAPAGNVNASVSSSYDENPANNHGVVDVTVG